jgi:hypothetical protein
MPDRNPGNRSPQLRATLLVIGLLIVLCALVALAFVFWPMPDAGLQITLPATLLTPP